MAKIAEQSELPPLRLERESRKPLSQQLQGEIARAILDGRLKPGARLPSTRRLSSDLGLARNTVNAAYDQLLAEGYIECAVGSGTRVAPALPSDIGLRAGQQNHRARRPGPQLSQRGARLTAAMRSARTMEARGPAVGSPDLETFPIKQWKRFMTQQIAALPSAAFGYSHPAGYAPLRKAIADHLGRTRGMSVSAEHVIVVAGTQQALDLAARILLDLGDSILFEDPGYLGARMAFLAAGVTLQPVPVDAEGMEIGRAWHLDARAAYVTPAHQFPLGMTMSLARRLALLEWAEERNAWIFEDDYDGEYRYGSDPISAIASLDTSGRVVYIGTFSKVVSPALRIGFMVVPPPLLEQIATARRYSDRQSPIFEQAALAAFMESGAFARHVRRMRTIYEERRDVLVRALERHGKDLVEVEAPQTGLHVTAWLRGGIDDVRVAEAIGSGAAPLAALPISGYCMRPLRRGGLQVAFSQAPATAIEPAVRRIVEGIRKTTRSSSIARGKQ